MVGVFARSPTSIRARLEHGEPEVQHFHEAVGRNEDVGRFDVAMDDTTFVCRAQRMRHARAVLEGLACRERPAGQPVAQRFTGEQLHHRVGRATVAADIVNRQDVGMRKRRDRLGLALEPRQRRRIVRNRGREHFDGDITIEARIARAIDLAHPAFAQLRQDAVRAKGLTNHVGGL